MRLERRALRAQGADQRERDRDHETEREQTHADVDPQAAIVDVPDRLGVGARGGLVDLDEVDDRFRDLGDQRGGPGLVPQVGEQRLEVVPLVALARARRDRIERARIGVDLPGDRRELRLIDAGRRQPVRVRAQVVGERDRAQRVVEQQRGALRGLAIDHHVHAERADGQHDHQHEREQRRPRVGNRAALQESPSTP